MQTECCTVYLANNDRQRLELMATQGLIFEGNSIHIGFDEGLAGLAKRSAEPINLGTRLLTLLISFFQNSGENIYHFSW